MKSYASLVRAVGPSCAQSNNGMHPTADSITVICETCLPDVLHARRVMSELASRI